MADNDKNTPEIQLKKLLEFDLRLRKIIRGCSDVDEFRHLRAMAKDLIVNQSNGTIDCTVSFSKVLKSACGNSKAKRFSALLILRILDVQGPLLRNQEEKFIEQNAVNLVKSSLPEFDSAFNFSEKKETYEKISQMEQVHEAIMGKLLPLKHLPLVMQDIISQKNEIYKTVNNKLVKSYLRDYDYSNVKNKIHALFDRSEELLNIYPKRFRFRR